MFYAEIRTENKRDPQGLPLEQDEAEARAWAQKHGITIEEMEDSHGMFLVELPTALEEKLEEDGWLEIEDEEGFCHIERD